MSSTTSNQLVPKPQSVQKNMLFNTVGSLMYQGCLWLITVLVVVLAKGYNDSGVLSFAMTIGNMFTAVGTFNIRTYQVSDVRNKYSQQNYVAFRLVTLVIGVVIMGAYSIVVSPDTATLIAVFAFLLFKIDESFVDVMYGVDQRGQRMDYIGISQFIRGVLVIVAFCAGMVLAHSLVVAILLMFPACLLVTVFYDIPHAHRFGSVKPQITTAQTKALLVECLPLVLETLFLGMIVSVARQYFSNAFGNELLGEYAAVATPAVLVQAAARYMYAPALVPLSERWGEDPQQKFLPYFKKTVVIMLVFIAVMVPLLSLVGPWALCLVYGQSIAPYTYLFTNVLICTGSIALLYYLTDVLVICRDIRGALIASVASLAVSLATMVPLEGIFQMQGINYTVMLATAAGVLVSALLLARRIHTVKRG